MQLQFGACGVKYAEVSEKRPKLVGGLALVTFNTVEP